jgi:hypothetical protein
LTAGAFATLALAGCGDEVCGPGDAPPDGVVASVAGETIRYGGFTSSPNNDCTPPGAQATSLTVDGRQLDPQPSGSYGITLCIPRPGDLNGALVTLGDPDRLQLIDIYAELADGCLVQFDRTGQLSGTASFEGFCGDGTDPAGYAIAFDAGVPVTRMCDGQADTLQLSGRVAVEAMTF